jgi:hypothetical protein
MAKPATKPSADWRRLVLYMLADGFCGTLGLFRNPAIRCIFVPLEWFHERLHKA